MSLRLRALLKRLGVTQERLADLSTPPGEKEPLLNRGLLNHALNQKNEAQADRWYRGLSAAVNAVSTLEVPVSFERMADYVRGRISLDDLFAPEEEPPPPSGASSAVALIRSDPRSPREVAIELVTGLARAPADEKRVLAMVATLDEIAPDDAPLEWWLTRLFAVVGDRHATDAAKKASRKADAEAEALRVKAVRGEFRSGHKPDENRVEASARAAGTWREPEKSALSPRAKSHGKPA